MASSSPAVRSTAASSAAWDYGPLGVELKENIKRQWWRYMVTSREDVVGIDSSVILAPEVWVASGHVATFSDPLTECTSCHKRYRADHLEEAYEAKHGTPPGERPRRPQLPQLRQQGHLHRAQAVLRPALHPPRPDPGLRLGRLPAPRDRAGHLHQLRARCSRPRARSRRSASPRWASPSATRSRPATSSSAPASSSRWRWSSSSSRARTRSGRSTGWSSAGTGTRGLGLREENMRWYEHPKEKLSHYSKRTADIEYRFQLRRQRVGRAGGRRQPHRLRPHRALQGLRPGPLLLRPGGRRALDAVRHRARGRCRPRDARLPARRVHRGRGAQRQGRDGEAHRAAPRPAPGAGQGRGAAAVPQPGAVAEGQGPRHRPAPATGTSSSTTRAPSAAATAARTRSARRSASPSTSTPSTTTR